MAMAISIGLLCIAGLLAFRWLVDAPGRLAGGAAREARATAAATAHGLAEIGRAAAGAFERVLMVRPRVVVGEKTIIEQQASVTKLVLLERDLNVTRDMQHTFLRSTKRLSLRGHFRATVGFDLGRQFTLHLDPERIVVTVPEPEILGIAMLDYEVVEDRDGLWNKITPEDREGATRELLDAAHRKAAELDLPKAAEEELRKRMASVEAAMPERPIELAIRKNDAPPPPAEKKF